MAGLKKQVEHHSVERLGWLRAAVLGANDGLLSTASLIIGVARAHSSRDFLPPSLRQSVRPVAPIICCPPRLRISRGVVKQAG
jgi:hypothetical protein